MSANWLVARLRLAVMLAAVFVPFGCTSLYHAPPSSNAAVQNADTGFPYHPLVYHLDLSMLAYHLHAQTLVWPIDPYYEAAPGGELGRALLMKRVHNWARIQARKQAIRGLDPSAYRGPGVLSALDENPLHDPIISRYDGLSPWSRAITNNGSRWVEYMPSKPISNRIHQVYMCHGKMGAAKNAVRVEPVASNSAVNGKDVLFAFEGATGDKGETGNPASQSLMGFVLLRHRLDGPGYDIHLSFRGSRSGSLLRTLVQANWDVRARGNPDWITDLGYDLIGTGKTAKLVAQRGRVHRGFARSTELSLPNIFACLNKAGSLKPGTAPRNIFVTGHSLGGALAQHFVSAVLEGVRYGPAATGPGMPDGLRSWPWKQIKLMTFSAPRAGDQTWAETLTAEWLGSEFHSKDMFRYDYDALAGNDPEIVDRLSDPNKPAGYRILVSNDAVSTSLISGRKPVGKTVYVDKLRWLSIAAPHNPQSHDPGVVRDLLVSSLSDQRIPASPWGYRGSPDTDTDQKSDDSLNETAYSRLFSQFLTYHRVNNTGLDPRPYMRDFNIFNRILKAQ